mgnify:CR=1 FL=1
MLDVRDVRNMNNFGEPRKLLQEEHIKTKKMWKDIFSDESVSFLDYYYSEKIKDNDIRLGVVLDFPQLLTAEGLNTLKFNVDKYLSLIDDISKHREVIKGIHIWGKKKSASGRWVAHAGTLDTYFGGNADAKISFIAGIHRVCNDGRKRFLVPEVNSGADDLAEIIADLLEKI